MRILYDSKSAEFKKPFGTLKEGQECKINIHIPASCKTKTVSLEFFKEDGGEYAAFSLYKKSEYEAYEIYSCNFSLDEAGLYFYRFFIETENESFPLLKEGYGDTNMCAGDLWQLSVLPHDFTVPESFCGKVMYQIFPDRFCREGICDLRGKLEPFTVHADLTDIPDFLPDEKGEVLNNDFFGGNLKGIEKKLSYIKDLGVSVIYLNPIFKAFSNHRYDTADYKKIDEMLGTEEDFKSLCRAAHKKGIRIILDGVFSHTGSRSVYFDKQNEFENGAYHCPDSPYREWFDFKTYPSDYTSWWGIKTLPCVKELTKSYMDFIINDEDSVVAHWLKLGADGFRLDVADELPDEFILALRKRVKEIKSDALVIGEVWEDASNKIAYDKRRKYFVGAELDSTMNYPFKNAIVDFCLGKDSGHAFKNTVMTICENYPSETLNVLMNSLSTHDTHRILTVLSGINPPESKGDRAKFKLTEEQRSLAIARLKCAAFLQFVLPGMPCIYYGDEIGTEGFEDPFCRSFFDWDRVRRNELLSFYKVISKLRNRSEALKFGNTKVEIFGENMIRIERRYKNRYSKAYINLSDKAFEVYDNGKTKMAENYDMEQCSYFIKQYGFVLFEG